VISKICKSVQVYSWVAGGHNKKAHRKALREAKKKRKQQRGNPKVSAMGWLM
jgi:hypothetical protein